MNTNPIKNATIKDGKLTVTLEFDVNPAITGQFEGIRTAESGNYQLSPKRYFPLSALGGLSLGVNLTFNPNTSKKADTKQVALQALLASGMDEKAAKMALGLK